MKMLTEGPAKNQLARPVKLDLMGESIMVRKTYERASDKHLGRSCLKIC